MLMNILLGMIASTLLFFNADDGQMTASALADIQTAMAQVQAKFKDKDEAINKLIEDAGQSLDDLTQRWTEGKKPLAEEYLQSLKHLNALLVNVSETDDMKKVRAILEDVALDAKAKSKGAKTGFGLTGNLRGLVKVTVKTEKDGKELGGYLVRCNPKRYADLKDSLYPFTNPSSPTTRSLPPGRYEMWVEKGEFKSKLLPITLGLNGEPEETVRFSIQ
jgi:hypothetical protein